jgi:hypothetical protein
LLEERARGAGLTLGEWVREALLAEPEESGAEVAGEVVLAELLALRTLFLNLRPLPGHGLPTEEEVRAEVARVDGAKRRRWLRLRFLQYAERGRINWNNS